ncbi:MAG: TIGR00725 family protein [Candidatus Bathyarchaeia archaeon]
MKHEGTKWRGVVAVIGTSEYDPLYYHYAEEIGTELAKRGVLVICGGRGGVMEAVCKGVKKAGGISVGILPGGLEEANQFVTVPVATFLGEARNAIVAFAGQVVIAIGGGYGTLSEIALALKMGKPVIALNTWRAVDPSGKELPLIYVNSVSEAIQKIEELLKLQ